LLGALAVFCSAKGAQAQELDDEFPENDWRREHRQIASPQHWAFELRFGSYSPRIDEEFKTSPGPYERVFGNSARVSLGAELSYQLIRIPWLGTLGPGAGWTYTKMNAYAKITGTDTDSAEQTSLWIMPMNVMGVLRADVFARELHLPIVPYAKLGVEYAIWRASNDLGRSDYNGVAGKGHSYGPYYAYGLSLQLDFLDQHSAQNLDNAVGINHSYIFFEFLNANLNGFGSGGQMRVGTNSWATGLAFEL
jgi:hypothetical protein